MKQDGPYDDTTGEYEPGKADNSYETETETDCSDWCDVRAPHEANDGWCPVGASWDGSCIESCSQATDGSRKDVLQRCVEDDPLCFVTLEQCMVSQENAIDCEGWCDARETEHANEGFCEPSLQGSPASDCRSVCLTGLADGLSRTGLESCIRDDALCFVSLGDCAASAGR